LSVAGQPGFLGDNPDVARTVFSVVGPTLSSLAQEQITQRITGLPFLGPLVEQTQFQFQFQGGYAGPQEATGVSVFQAQNLSNSLTNYLYTSSVGGQLQLTDRLSLGVSTGLCLLSAQNR